MTISLPGASACGTAGAVCTRGDDPRPLSNSPSATVAGPPADPLTASFSGMPSEHAGEGTFTFGLTFSENVTLSYKTLRDAAFSVSAGAVRKAEREQQGSNAAWEITVEPDSAGAVTIGLPETTDCDASGAICTADGRALSHSLSATVMGPVGISVADARVDENGGAPLAFAVTLSRATDSALTVDYATADGSAQAGVDYTAVSGTLTFQAGESSQTVTVTVLDDSHNDTEETLTLTLSNPSERPADGRGGDRDDRRTRTRCRGRCWRGSVARRWCTWSSTSRNDCRRRGSRASRAGSRGASCGAVWSATWRSAF